MAMTLGIVSKTSGIGKSTLSRLIVREFAAQGREVKIADLDITQPPAFIGGAAACNAAWSRTSLRLTYTSSRNPPTAKAHYPRKPR